MSLALGKQIIFVCYFLSYDLETATKHPSGGELSDDSS
ncbi:hypothetical protein PORCRE_1653 [Porphyromonas crevioricanis JCM 15906]|uniref:Uncharacterized protein n=1 Tax=Porphyromonas crevioricanis JCM 15906 TaxID=1305617 RepID=T1CQ12_9PORP|nr:hypothetical protein PORCRE_1653 [Porphyromonas crevioricanis JCM 15906]GAD08333.1 hypothetical protein PORCAN_1972 [Porphyromonas crevioricanis JCM 13913]